jgi:hypothetical protein
MLVEKYVDANRDRLLVSYMTSEGWKCKAEVHRFHVLSAGRHQTLVDEYQDRFLDAAINFMETPAMHAVGDVLDKVRFIYIYIYINRHKETGIFMNF